MPLQLGCLKLGGVGTRCGNAKKRQNLKICLKIVQVEQTSISRHHNFSVAVTCCLDCVNVTFRLVTN